MDQTFLDPVDEALTGWGDPAERLRAALDNDELMLHCQPIRPLTGAEHYPMAEVHGVQARRVHSRPPALMQLGGGPPARRGSNPQPGFFISAAGVAEVAADQGAEK
jgi:hypothetical protein